MAFVGLDPEDQALSVHIDQLRMCGSVSIFTKCPDNVQASVCVVTIHVLDNRLYCSGIKGERVFGSLMA